MSESILFFLIIKIDSDIRQNDIMPLNIGNCIITLERKFLETDIPHFSNMKELSLYLATSFS